MLKAAIALATAALFLGFGAGSTSAVKPPLGRLCTLVACSGGVSIEVGQVEKAMPAAWTIDVCIGNRCTSDPLYQSDEPGLVPSGSVSGRADAVRGVGPYVVSIAVRDRDGNVMFRAGRIVTMEKYYPNGRECGGLCFILDLKLTAGRELVLLRRLRHSA